jgi:hypothetical protein
MARAKKSSVLSQSYFDSYAEYNRILRSWFVAFGVGGLALFLLQSRFWARIASQFWIDIILDVLTVVCFLAAIWRLFEIFAR